MMTLFIGPPDTKSEFMNIAQPQGKKKEEIETGSILLLNTSCLPARLK
jgi:hypothetical protein